MALGKSCLLANTSREASRSSSCAGEAEGGVEQKQVNEERGAPRAYLQNVRLFGTERLHPPYFLQKPNTIGAFPVIPLPHLVQHAHQLVPGLSYTVSIVAIHHEDEALRVLEVVAPQWADLWGTACQMQGRLCERRGAEPALRQLAAHPGHPSTPLPSLTLS